MIFHLKYFSCIILGKLFYFGQTNLRQTNVRIILQRCRICFAIIKSSVNISNKKLKVWFRGVLLSRHISEMFISSSTILSCDHHLWWNTLYNRTALLVLVHVLVYTYFILLANTIIDSVFIYCLTERFWVM